MKKAQSPYNQRNQFSNFHCEDDSNNKTKQQSGSYSALKNIKAAVKKVFTVLLFRRKVNSKAAASVIDPRKNSNRIRGVSCKFHYCFWFTICVAGCLEMLYIGDRIGGSLSIVKYIALRICVC